MAFSSLKDLLGSTLPAQCDWQSRLAREWATALGDLHTRMRLERIQGTTVIIGVFDSHWIHELFMLSPLIIQTINTHLGKIYITHVRFIVANQRKKSTPKEKVPCQSHNRKTMSSRQELILRSVKDVQLQEILEKVFYHCVV